MPKIRTKDQSLLYYLESPTGGSTPTCCDGSSDTRKKHPSNKKNNKKECKSSSLETLQEIWSATADCAGNSQNKQVSNL